MNKKILLLAANPKDTTRLRLDKEFREIDVRLRLSKQRDYFEIKQKGAVRVEDLQQALLNEEPHIVHFSGHGEHEGIILENQSGKATLVNPEGLSELFEILAEGIECVVLNACYSETQAKAIGQHIPFVIGMKKEIGDKAAIEFSVGFYNGIGAGKSVEQAYRLGRNAIQLQNIPEHLTPVLKKKSDILSVPTQSDTNDNSTKVREAPMSEQELKKVHIDRDEEKASFLDMIHGKSYAHILLIEADSGMGKTALLNEFRKMSQDLKCAHVDFKKMSAAFGEILSDLSHQLGEDSFKSLHNQCRQVAQDRGWNIGEVLFLILSQIDVKLDKLPDEDRAKERNAITEAFFADLTSIHQTTQKSLVLIFDTFEKPSSDVKVWINEQFITRIRRYPWLICVFAGQEIPKIDRDPNDKWCLERKLQKLNVDHVREYVETLKLTLSDEAIIHLTKYSDGNPLSLQTLVLKLL